MGLDEIPIQIAINYYRFIFLGLGGQTRRFTQERDYSPYMYSVYHYECKGLPWSVGNKQNKKYTLMATLTDTP